MFFLFIYDDVWVVLWIIVVIGWWIVFIKFVIVDIFGVIWIWIFKSWYDYC